MTALRNPDDLTGALLDAARRAGAEAADALAVESRQIGVGARGGALEEAESSESLDFGLRVLIGPRQACVSASDPRPDVFQELAERAVAMARAAPEDLHCGLLEASELSAAPPDLDLADPGDPPPAAALEDLARRAEAAALAVSGVAQVEQASAGWSRSRISLAATNGFCGGYAQTRWSIGASAIAGEGLGMETDGEYAVRRYRADLPSPEEIGATAGERAAAKLGARKPPTGPCPVIYDRRVAPSLVSHLVGAANGASVARGSSWLTGRMGEPVLPPGYDLIEDPHLARGPASRPFDAEGAPTRAKHLVSGGVLRTWLMDAASARRLGLATTGNASRGVSGPPSPSSSNIRLTGGGRPRAALIGEIGGGLLITGLIGRSINPTTGDYSRGASGFWIEKGEIAYPVNELTVAGALPPMLLSIEAADDPDLSRATAAPTLRVEGLTIAGA